MKNLNDKFKKKCYVFKIPSKLKIHLFRIRLSWCSNYMYVFQFRFLLFTFSWRTGISNLWWNTIEMRSFTREGRCHVLKNIWPFLYFCFWFRVISLWTDFYFSEGMVTLTAEFLLSNQKALSNSHLGRHSQRNVYHHI